MQFRTLCRNPNCLKPLHGQTPVKLWCNHTCKTKYHQFANSATREQKAAYEDRFVAAFEQAYDSVCFGIEVEYGNEQTYDPISFGKEVEHGN